MGFRLSIRWLAPIHHTPEPYKRVGMRRVVDMSCSVKIEAPIAKTRPRTRGMMRRVFAAVKCAWVLKERLLSIVILRSVIVGELLMLWPPTLMVVLGFPWEPIWKRCISSLLFGSYLVSRGNLGSVQNQIVLGSRICR